jgi:hypothetical protein
MARQAGRGGRQSDVLSPEDWDRLRSRAKRADRRDVHAPRVFLLIVAVVLVFWLAFMLSTALMSIGMEFPAVAIDDAGAATLPCAATSCASTTPQDFDVTPTAGRWAVVGARSTAQLGDVQTCVFKDAGRTQTLACSNLAGLKNVEFVALDFHHTPAATRYSRITRLSGSGEMCTTFDCGATTLLPGLTPFTGSWSGQVVRVFNVVLQGNTPYRIGLVETSGTVDFGVALFNSAGQVDYAAGRTLAATQADIHGSGMGEGIFYRPAATDTFGLVVWSNNAGTTANYRIDVRQETELLPNASTNGGGSQADWFFAPPAPRGWNVVALRPMGSSGSPVDADLRLFNGPDHATLLRASNAEPNIVDFIVANYANVPEDTAWVLTISFGPVGNFELSLLSNPPALSSGISVPFDLTGSVGGGRRVQLTAGVQYQFVFDPADGTTGDIALGLYGPRVGQPLFTYGTRADSIAGSDAWGAAPGGWFGNNGIETFFFTPALSGEYLLFAYRKTGAAASGELRYFPTSLLPVEPMAHELELAPPWPSPARVGQSVRMRFALSRAGSATLVLVDARGRIVRRLGAGSFEAGPHDLAWDGRLEGGALAPAGVYVVRLDAEGRTATRRVLWLP